MPAVLQLTSISAGLATKIAKDLARETATFSLLTFSKAARQVAVIGEKMGNFSISCIWENFPYNERHEPFTCLPQTQPRLAG